VVDGVKDHLEEHAERARNRKWADDAWKTIGSAPEGCPYSVDHAQGFKDGFAEYLYEGGSGEPPPLPPRRYWSMSYQTPQGYQAVEDWFAGFRHGAWLARQGDYRKWVTVPLSARHPNFERPPLDATEPAPVPKTGAEELPRPKVVLLSVEAAPTTEHAAK